MYKSTADVESAQKMYLHYSFVGDDYLKLREIVLRRKMPRRNLVQPHVYLEDGKEPIPLRCHKVIYLLLILLGSVKLRDFEPSFEGVVQSFVARYPSVDPDLKALWEKDHKHWN